MSIGVVVTKIMTFFYKCMHVGLDICCGDLRQWVGLWERRQYAHTNWHTGWLHAGPLQRRGRHVADWPLRV